MFKYFLCVIIFKLIVAAPYWSDDSVIFFPPQLHNSRRVRNDNDGKSCLVNAFISGTCKRITNCPLAMASVRKNGTHGFPRCGFDNNIELVCCLDGDSNKPTTSTSTIGYNKNRDCTEQSSTSTTKTTISTTTTKTTTERSQIPNKNVKIGVRSQQACMEYTNEVPLSIQLLIMGGTNAQLGDFPHMAAIGYEEDSTIKYECGGSLISDRYVLTAAHCIQREDEIQPTVVRLGKVDIRNNTDPHDYNIERTIVHPKYQTIFHYHDIGLLRLDRPVQNTAFIHPACLYTRDELPSILTATGWGLRSAFEIEDPTKILKKVYLDLFDQNTCNNMYSARRDRRLSNGIVDAQLCAYGDGKRDACSGDSGGPLQVALQNTTPGMYYIVGVTSFGIGCGSKYPGVYVRVSKYIDWIEQNVWP